MSGFAQDVGLATRALRKTPGFTVVVVLMLALGIGANAGIFSLINSVMLRSLQVKEPDRLVLIRDADPQTYPLWSYAVWDQLHSRHHLFDGVAAWSATRFNLSTGGEADFVEGLWASSAFLQVLGIEPRLGRTFIDADNTTGGGPDGPVAVVSYDFWHRRLGGRSDVIGHALVIDNVPLTIVGVTPRGFFGIDVGRRFDVIVPLNHEPLFRGSETWLDQPHALWLTIVARLKPTQTLEAADLVLRTAHPDIREATIPRRLGEPIAERVLKAGFRRAPLIQRELRLRQRL